MPESTSVYADEGRLAHAIGELKLRKYFTPMGPRKFTSELKKLQGDPLYQDEMLPNTDAYLEYVQSAAHAYASSPYVTIEKRLDYSHVAPKGFGTGDCIIIGEKLLHVVDFKYGKGVPVDAAKNPQMLLYALGALAEYAILYAIDTVRMTIVQPRLANISCCEISVDELRAWGEIIKPLAQQAHEGKGEFCSGEWCRFCRAKAQCRARCDTQTALGAFGNMKPPLISNEEVGAILQKARDLAAWVSDLEDYALTAILRGEDITGWKAVEGRSNRQLSDTDMAFEVVKGAGYDEALLYERKPITLTAVEKLLGTAKFMELLNDYVIKPPGKPTLALQIDKREAISNQTTAVEAFAQPTD